LIRELRRVSVLVGPGGWFNFFLIRLGIPGMDTFGLGDADFRDLRGRIAPASSRLKYAPSSFHPLVSSFFGIRRSHGNCTSVVEQPAQRKGSAVPYVATARVALLHSKQTYVRLLISVERLG